MCSRAWRNHRLRNRAWALVVALLSSTECWAMDGQDPAAAGPQTTSSTSAASSPGSIDTRSTRPRIPPPRQYSPEELQARGLTLRPGGPKIPLPRQIVTSSNAQQPLFAPVPVQPPPHDAEPLFRPVSDRPAQIPDVPKTGPEAAESPSPGAVAGSRPASITTPVSSGRAAEPVANTPDLTQTLQGSSGTPGTEVAPASSTFVEPGIERGAVAVSPQPAEELSTSPKAVETAREENGSPKAESKSQTAESQVDTSAPATGANAKTGAMPVSVQQALETLAKPPVAGPAPTSESAPGLEFQLWPRDEQANAPEAAAGPAPTSAPVNQTPKAVEGAPPAGLAEAVAAQSSVPAATASLSPGSGPTQTQVPLEPALQPAPAVSQAVRFEQSPDPGTGQPDRTKDSRVERTQCPTCGGFHSALDGPSLHGFLTCEGKNCVPGQKPCYPPANECNTVVGGFLSNLYQEICCPDPCYQPKWDPAAYASFFADYARPRTVTRIRYDNLEAMTRPDRNQFWINQVTLLRSNPNRTFTNPRARLQQVYLYQEAAGERGSFFVEVAYRQINSNWEPTQAGFGDINFGVKSLLFDCEMLQVTFQMRTYMPSGNFKNNLGTGQFVVDPSILTSLKLSPTTYFQGQFGNWIPLGGPGGNSQLAGGIFYWLMSVNQVLWYTTPDSPLIATLEMDGWSFENGDYTAFIPRNQKSASGLGTGGLVEKGGGVSYFNIGPGFRQSICNRLDFGGAITWAANNVHWAQPWFRFEVRFLF